MKKIIILTILILFAAAFVSAQTQKCFKNNGLKDGHTIYLTVSGTKISGVFTVLRDYETPEDYKFSGTNLNNNLTVIFAGNKFPYQLPPKTKKGVWTLKKSGDVETLAIKIYGKNYETNKYSTYFADYESCEPGYETLSKQARKVSFAKGSTSATVETSFTSADERKAFSLTLRKAQKFYVEAPGCAIAVYFPDKTPDPEGAIDTWGFDSLPQDGNYLFVFSPAGVPGKCSVKFLTN